MEFCPHCQEELCRSTDGTVKQLQARIVFLEDQLIQTAMAQPRCSEQAFQQHVNARVDEAVRQEQARSNMIMGKLKKALHFAASKSIREREEWRCELLSENIMLEAVLQKYNIPLEDAKQAASEYEQTLSEKTSIENDPAYTKFLKISKRGRSSHRNPPLADPYGFLQQ